jgi:hypothetical protein
MSCSSCIRNIMQETPVPREYGFSRRRAKLAPVHVESSCCLRHRGWAAAAVRRGLGTACGSRGAVGVVDSAEASHTAAAATGHEKIRLEPIRLLELIRLEPIRLLELILWS